MKLMPLPRSQRGAALEQKACSALAVGRSAEALEAVREARRLRAGHDPVRLGFLEVEALLGAERHGDVVALTARLLAGNPDADHRARLRAARAQALVLDGRLPAARRETALAWDEAATPLTRGRVLEAQALLARREGRLEDALRALEGALQLYSSQDYALGASRVLGAGARITRELVRLDDAHALRQRWEETAGTVTRRRELAHSHAERAESLLQLGHWKDAGDAARAAAEEFHRLDDPREHTEAGVILARVLLAQADLTGARQLLLRAELAPDAPGVARAELGLHRADLELALGNVKGALDAARASLEIFDRLHDVDGACRTRVRLAQALLDDGQPGAALREASRGVRQVRRPDLQTLCQLALGRVLLRGGRAQAADAFAAALASALPEHGYWFAARLGLAVARGRGQDHEEVAAALAGLERWGDRRLVALCLHDLRRGRPIAGDQVAAPRQRAIFPVLPPATERLVDVACRLMREGASWVDAARGLGDLLPWRRLVLVSAQSWEAVPGRDGAIPLAEDDPWPQVVRDLRAPALLRHEDVPALLATPATRLHALDHAIVVTTGDGATLVAETAGEPSAEALGLASALARLLTAPEPPVEEPAPIPGLIAHCEPMQQLLRDAFAAAGHRAAVHVFGESGTGKERIALAIHERSPRHRGPFVPVNVAAIASELFESEMFGSVKGAFTGAIDKPGYVAAAEGGTLFLDEIAELSPHAQSKLLRFLQQWEYRRVGETQLRKADVRIVTATNVRLAELVRENRFRQDLWFRLNVLTLDVPPLRERGDDILRIARTRLRAEAAHNGRPAPEISPAAARLLKAYAWPGNVRELENEMARVLLKCGRGPVQPEHLSADLRTGPEAPAATLREMATATERRTISDALALHGGNRSRAARSLGLSRQALHVKLGRLGIG